MKLKGRSREMPLEIERTGGMEEDSQEEQEALIDRFEGLSPVGGRPELYEEVLKAYSKKLQKN